MRTYWTLVGRQKDEDARRQVVAEDVRWSPETKEKPGLYRDVPLVRGCRASRRDIIGSYPGDLIFAQKSPAKLDRASLSANGSP